MTKQNQTLTIKQPIHVSPRQTESIKAKIARLHTQSLVRLGLRSHCCGAKIAVWHHDKYYCERCEGWLHAGKRQIH